MYVLDLLGYGDSERRERQDVSITAQGRMLAELLNLWADRGAGSARLGQEDRWLDRSVAERLRDAIPHAELVLVPGAGHFAPEDEPGAVANALAEFFAASLARTS